MSSFSIGHWIILGILLWFGFTALSSSKTRTALFCKSCGHVGRPESHTPGNVFIEIILWLCIIVPGLIYSIWRVSSRKPKCPKCGSLELVPTDSPVALAAQQQLGIVPAVQKDFS